MMPQAREHSSPSARKPLAARARGLDRWLGVCMLAAALSLAVGWTAPIMTVTRLFVFDEAVSVLGALTALIENGEILLFAVILVFGVLIPAMKLALGYGLWRLADPASKNFRRRVRIVDSIGRWSMLDVFVVALLVAAAKVSLIADVHLHWGLYMLIAGILLSMAALSRLTSLTVRDSHPPAVDVE